MTDEIHDWDGAYVLGALGPDDRRRYEAHLADCPPCAAAVQALAGLPGLLGGLDAEAATALRDAPDRAEEAAHVPGRLAGVARRAARRRRRTAAAAALALSAAVVVASLAGWAATTAADPPTRLAAAHTLTPVGDSHLFARLRATPAGWGTRFDWSCDYRAASGSGGDYRPVSYSLVVVTTSGAQTTVATWTSDAGEARDLVASTAIPADTIRTVDIRRTGTAAPLAEVRF